MDVSTHDRELGFKETFFGVAKDPGGVLTAIRDPLTQSRRDIIQHVLEFAEASLQMRDLYLSVFSSDAVARLLFLLLA